MNREAPSSLKDILGSSSTNGKYNGSATGTTTTTDASLLAKQQEFENARRLLAQQIDRIRRFDTIALSHSRRFTPTETTPSNTKNGPEGSFGSSGDFDTSVMNSIDTDTSVRTSTEPGLPIDYCVFCYHGTNKLLRHENTALLSRFVSERGAILPKRFTKACTKHQRLLSKVIQRSRWLNLLPYHQKLHPRLRFSSMRPDISRESSIAGITNTAVLGGSGLSNTNNDIFANLSGSGTKQQQQYLHEIATGTNTGKGGKS